MIRSGAQGQPRAGNRRRAGCVWALAAALMVIFAGGALLVLAHRPLLGALGSYLVVDEPPETVEAIVAVSGEHRRRRTAMDLYQEGWAELLIFNVSDTTYYFGAPIDPVSSVVASAAERGIPSDSIVINSPICSTYEDALATRETIRRLGLSSIMVVTDSFNSRRVCLTYRKVMRDMNLRLVFCCVPLEKQKMSQERWWTHEREFVTVVNEYMKLVFYYFKYLNFTRQTGG